MAQASVHASRAPWIARNAVGVGATQVPHACVCRELRTAKREVFRKIISLVSVGMDMSSLLPTMISCANLSADNLVLNKMLYLYITHYATQIPEMTLLAINQLHKDCRDQDPTVRGLALRSLCSLRVPNFLEYVVSASPLVDWRGCGAHAGSWWRAGQVPIAAQPVASPRGWVCVGRAAGTGDSPMVP